LVDGCPLGLFSQRQRKRLQVTLEASQHSLRINSADLELELEMVKFGFEREFGYENENIVLESESRSGARRMSPWLPDWQTRKMSGPMNGLRQNGAPVVGLTALPEHLP
jgi:hypothetical protein